MLPRTKTANNRISLLEFFFFASVLGWFWETAVYWASHPVPLVVVIANLRGFLHGPWVPIYGVGCILMLALREYFPQKPVHFFLSSVVTCGILEFGVSWFLERTFHARWWDYSGQFLNLDGRICLGGLLFFGLAGLMVVYQLEPAFQGWMQRVSLQKRRALCSLLVLLFTIDFLYSSTVPNLGIGVRIL